MSLPKESDFHNLVGFEQYHHEKYPYLTVETNGQQAAVVLYTDIDGTLNPDFIESKGGKYILASETDRWSEENLRFARRTIALANENSIPVGLASSRALKECLNFQETLGVRYQGPIGAEDGAGLFLPNDYNPQRYLLDHYRTEAVENGWFIHTSEIQGLDVFEKVFDALREMGYEGKFIDTLYASRDENLLIRMSAILGHSNLEHTRGATTRVASAFLITYLQDETSYSLRQDAIRLADKAGLISQDYAPGPLIMRPNRSDKFSVLRLYQTYLQNRYGIPLLHVIAAGNGRNDIEIAHGLSDPKEPQITGKMIFMAKSVEGGQVTYGISSEELEHLPKNVLIAPEVGPNGLIHVDKTIKDVIKLKA